MDDSDFIVL